MSVLDLKASKCPTDALSKSNCAIVNESDISASNVKHVEVQTGPAHRFVFSIRNDRGVNRGCIAFSMPQRKWAELSLDQRLRVSPFSMQPSQYIGCITIELDFFNKKNATSNPFDTDEMSREFTQMFGGQAFTRGQILAFDFKDKVLLAKVKEIEASDFVAATEGTKSTPKQIELGQLLPNSGVIFEKNDAALINLTGKSKGKQAFRSIVNPEWDFQKMGIGGLDKEFSAIFRRAFASRVFPPEFIEQLGMKHVRGILLFGPPGTGKTLMARQIGQMLNAREPKIVNGPQILDKYVGESEANIRKLFADAEEEAKRCGANSGLHIIIFDEIDAICKQRGSMAGSTAVHDTVVNQLLAKIDGVEQLNNILVIGMTNRRDMIDEALLRPGRLEVQMEISLPDESGRLQILNIHTERMKQFDKLDEDVDVVELSKRSKNFSGAEIEGLVRAAQSSAMNRLVKAASKVEVDPDAIEKLRVNMHDFLYALEHDIKPQFGHMEEVLENLLRGGFYVWGTPVRDMLSEGEMFVQQVKAPDTRGLVSVLIEGPPNSGKTALAATIAKDSEFPFVKVCSPEDMVGFSEPAKCAMLKKTFDDAYKSPLSVILIDDVERLLDYGPIGPRYSNLVLQALLVLLKKLPPKNRRLLILVTSSNRAILELLEVVPVFSTVLHVSPLVSGEQVLAVVETQEDALSKNEMSHLQTKLKNKSCMIGIKKLLDILDLVKQNPEGQRVNKLLIKLEEEANLPMV